jgi:hypothetical protein
MLCVQLQQMKQFLIKMSGKNFVNTSFHFFCKVLTDVLAYLLQSPSLVLTKHKHKSFWAGNVCVNITIYILVEFRMSIKVRVSCDRNRNDF